MTQKEYEAFLYRTKIGGRFGRSLIANESAVEVYVRSLNRIGQVDAITNNFILVVFDDETSKYFPYVDVFFLDTEKEPIIKPITDKFGQLLNIGDHVIFPLISDLGVGKIDNITEAGNIMVVSKTKSGKRTPRKVDPCRSVKMPIDDSTWMKLVLTDFRS